MVQRLLDASDNLPAFINDLVTTQAVMVAGTEAAAFLIEPKGEETGLRLITHIRPDESDAETRAAAVKAFESIVRRCVMEAKDGVIDVGAPDDGEPQFCLVTLMRTETAVVAVSAVIARARDRERAKQRLQSMQLVAGYFEIFSLRRFVEQSRLISERHQQVLQYTSAIATAEGFESASMNLCNEIATRAGASRVALGWVKGVQIKVKALSHTEKFDKKQELVVLLEKVMEECLDQEEPVRYDPSGKSTGNVTRAAAELSRRQGGNVVISVPLRQREEIVGVLTVEWPAGQQVDEADEAGVAVAAELLAPQLYDRFQNDRYIVTKMGLSVKKLAKATVGPKHTGVKLIIVALIGLIAFVAMYKPMYHVRASVVLSALEKQTICAPYDGILDDVYVRPGQPIQAGQVIGKMWTTDLEVKLAAAQAQVDNKKVTADKARREGKPAEAKIADLERDEAQRQVDLLDWYIKQSYLKAPFAGVMLRGDLMDRKGQKVKEGDPLFEIARNDEHDPGRLAIEAEMQVSEKDVQELKHILDDRAIAAKERKKQPLTDVEKARRDEMKANATRLQRAYDGELLARERAGTPLTDDEKKEIKAIRADEKRFNTAADGGLATTSFPDQEFKFVITRLVPAGEPKEGENTFKVYGRIEKPAPWMHPGLAGEPRLDVEPRRLAWIWTHRLTDWIKLKFWM